MRLGDYASCCVLSYERPGFLRTAVESLLSRAGAPLELIVHDDGSENHEVRALLRRWVDDGVVSTLIENPPGHNQGVGESMRRMFDLATGDPIIKVDQDLIFQEGWLAKVNEILVTNAADLELGTSIDMKVKRIGALGAFRYWTDPVDHNQMLIQERGLWTEVQDFVGSFIAIPRRVYEQFGPFETHSAAFAEDITFKHSLTAAGLALALPAEDIAHNQGFGVGPSTVVVAPETVREIHREPVIHAA
jgi:glycosyltransferase involved in cell wall biosynthesis